MKLIQRGGTIARSIGARLNGAVDVLAPPSYEAGAKAAEALGWAPDAPGDYCPRCGSTAPRESVTLTGCPHCRNLRIPWNGVWRLAAYDPPVSQWIVHYKFQRRWAWGAWFGRQLAEVTPETDLPDAGALVTPVPLHFSRRMRRGYDQAALVAEHFARTKGLALARLLRRRRRTARQTDLGSVAARAANVRRAFACAPVDLSGRTVWLVDDVKTTGATLAACTRVLRRRGADRVLCAVIAVADPGGGAFDRR